MQQPSDKNTSVDQLRQLQEDILSKIDYLGNLNTLYKNKQEREFLSTFMQIMDRMSNDLIAAQEQYANIDEQIQKDQRCMSLRQELEFFKDQYMALRHELSEIEEKTKVTKMENEQLLKERQQLKTVLVQQTKSISKYKIRANSLNRTIDHGGKTSQEFFKNTMKSELTPEKKKYSTLFHGHTNFAKTSFQPHHDKKSDILGSKGNRSVQLSQQQHRELSQPSRVADISNRLGGFEGRNKKKAAIL